MPRAIDPTALASLMAQETGEAYIILLQITDGASKVHRFTSDIINIVQGADTYVPYPFSLALPHNEEGRVSEANLIIDNVGRELVDELRLYAVPLEVEIQVVLGSDPTKILAKFLDFKMRDVAYNATTISGRLTMEDFLSEPVSTIMSAKYFPGLF